MTKEKPKIGKRLRNKWVKALRSGDYKQTTGQLKYKDSYCCLGVLCVVADMKISRDGENVTVNGKNSGYKPIEDILTSSKTGHLYSLNDTLGYSFKRIATYIEKTF